MKANKQLKTINIRKFGLPAMLSILLAVPVSNFVVKAQSSPPKQSQSQIIPMSTTAAKTFSSSVERGTRVVLSNHGNIVGFASPTGFEHIGNGEFSEGYVLCYTGKNAFDVASSESGFGSATLSNSTATKATFVRSTLDGFLQLRQDFSFNGTFRSLTINMTVTNPNGFTVSGVTLRRQVDFDIDNDNTNDFGTNSRDGVFAWNDAQGFTTENHGLMLRNVQRSSGISLPVAKVTRNILDTSCSPPPVVTPAIDQDLGSTLEYSLGSLAPFSSKKVTLIYERF